MISVREAIWAEQPTISIRLVIQRYPVPSPVSLRNLIAPESAIMRVDHDLSAGDLSGWGEVAYLSNGLWSYRGHLASDASLIGDEYTYGAWSDYKDASGNTVYFSQSGEIEPGDSDDWEQWGHSPWIAENWEGVRSHQTKFNLHQSANFGWDDFFRTLFVVGIPLLPLLFPGHCKWTTDEEGHPGVECQLTSAEQ